MHALPHGCGTALAEREGDLLAIQDHMGHANIKNTVTYIQITNKKRDDFAGHLETSGWGRRVR